MGGSEPAASAAVSRQLTTGGSFWIWFDSNLRLGPALKARDCFLVSQERAGSKLAVVDVAGQPKLAWAYGEPPGSVIGWAHQVWRPGLRFSLTSFPWRALRGHRYERLLMSAVDAVHAAKFLVSAALQQWRRVPTAAQVEARLLRLPAEAGHTQAMVGIADDGFWEGEDLLADRFLRPGLRLLDLGCGAGREAFGFAERGVEVTGGDASLALVSSATQRAERVPVPSPPRFVAMGLSRLGLRPAVFDAALLASAIYARIPGRRNRLRVLADCRRVLKPGGLLILEVNATPYPAARRLALRLAVDWPRALARPFLGASAPEVGDRFVPPAPDEGRGWHYRHRFSRPEEVEREVEDGGFAVREWVSGFLVAARQ